LGKPQMIPGLGGGLLKTKKELFKRKELKWEKDIPY